MIGLCTRNGNLAFFLGWWLGFLFWKHRRIKTFATGAGRCWLPLWPASTSTFKTRIPPALLISSKFKPTRSFENVLHQDSAVTRHNIYRIRSASCPALINSNPILEAHCSVGRAEPHLLSAKLRNILACVSACDTYRYTSDRVLQLAAKRVNVIYCTGAGSARRCTDGVYVWCSFF